MAFFGDGATNIGTFHEALNMAAVWKAPVVFVVENNLYGEYTPMRDTTPLDDLAERAKAYAMPGVIVDGQDVDAVHAAVSAAVERARAGEGPTLIEMKTYRYPRTLAYRPGEVPARGRARALEGARPDRRSSAPSWPPRACSTSEQARHLRTDVQAAGRRCRRRGRSRHPIPTFEEIASYVYAA